MKHDEYDVRIDRRSKWGNPFHITATYTREQSIERYREYITSNRELKGCLHELKGKRLGCWCKPLACHGDVLVSIVDLLT